MRTVVKCREHIQISRVKIHVLNKILYPSHMQKLTTRMNQPRIILFLQIMPDHLLPQKIRQGKRSIISTGQHHAIHQIINRQLLPRAQARSRPAYPHDLIRNRHKSFIKV